MTEYLDKEVYFGEKIIKDGEEVDNPFGCHHCKHKDLDDASDPCHDCLQHPSNQNSHKPIHFKEA